MNKDIWENVTRISLQLHVEDDGHTLRSSASGSGCPSANSLCLISSSSSFSLFLSLSSSSISFSRSRKRFCSALPLQAKQRNSTVLQKHLWKIQRCQFIRCTISDCGSSVTSMEPQPQSIERNRQGTTTINWLILFERCTIHLLYFQKCFG